MKRWQRLVVHALDRTCTALHFVTHHRPWLLIDRLPHNVSINCPLADLGFRLADRWERLGLDAETRKLLGSSTDDLERRWREAIRTDDGYPKPGESSVDLGRWSGDESKLPPPPRRYT